MPVSVFHKYSGLPSLSKDMQIKLSSSKSYDGMNSCLLFSDGAESSLSLCNSMIITMTEKCHHTPPEPKSTKAVWSRFQNFFLFFLFSWLSPQVIPNEWEEGTCRLRTCPSHFLQIHMMQRFKLWLPLPQGRPGQPAALRCPAGRREEGGGGGPKASLLLSYISLKSVPDRLATPILIRATQTQLHKLYRRLRRPSTNRPHKLSCYDFIVQHSNIYWFIDGIDFKQRCLFPSLRILFSKATLHYAAN